MLIRFGWPNAAKLGPKSFQKSIQERSWGCPDGSWGTLGSQDRTRPDSDLEGIPLGLKIRSDPIRSIISDLVWSDLVRSGEVRSDQVRSNQILDLNVDGS